MLFSKPIVRFSFLVGCGLLVSGVSVRAQVCEPAPEGFPCVPLACSPIPEDQCIATVVHLDVTDGALTAVQCECMDFNLCHVEFGDAKPFPVGNCPPGQSCEVFGWDTDADGMNDHFTAQCITSKIGACCQDITDGPIPYETCTDSDKKSCLADGGIFHGVNTGCSEVQACCLTFAGAGFCAEMSPFCCIDSHGVPQGPGSTCLDPNGIDVCGQICGGIAGIPCEDLTEFCKLPPGHCCCDFLGICTPRPNACPEIWDPVCGCDGVTYANECEADAAGVSIDHAGPCGKPCSDLLGMISCLDTEFCLFPEGKCDDGMHLGVCTPRPNACPLVWDPVCGCDGKTYGNECEAYAAGVSIRYRGECKKPGACCLPDGTCADNLPLKACVALGGVPTPGSPCAAVSCEVQVGACCVTDSTGKVSCFVGTEAECLKKGGAYQGDGTTCPSDPNEPCGEPCKVLCPPGLECFSGCGELIQGVECVLFKADSGGLHVLSNLGGFNVGDRVFVTGCHDPDCDTFCMQGDGCILNNTIKPCGRICGGIAGIPCKDPNEFCKLPMGKCCCDFQGICTPIPDACPDVWDPVCGCDGVTYGNECEADAAAVSVAYPGECQVCVATRVLSDPELSYCAGVTKRVRIVLNPPASVTALALEDSPPAGWAVGNISDGGVFDTVNWKVKWGPFFAPSIPAEVGYDVTPANEASVPACFTGTVSVDGLNQPICGDDCIDSHCCSRMQADLPQPACPACPIGDCTTCPSQGCGNGRISLCELIGYACAWMRGCNDDLAGVTRAAFIWKTGECYCWDDAGQNWFPTTCPPPPSGCCNADNPPGGSRDGLSLGDKKAGSASAIVRPVRGGTLSAIRELKISVAIEASEGTSATALYVYVPKHWKVTGISDGGQWDALHRKVKWGPFFENLSRTVTFKAHRITDMPSTGARPPRGERGLDGFAGTVSFDGVNQPITIER